VELEKGEGVNVKNKQQPTSKTWIELLLASVNNV